MSGLWIVELELKIICVNSPIRREGIENISSSGGN